MQIKRLPFLLIPLLSLMITPIVVQAATITTCTFDKNTYHQGETGYIKVTIYNDENYKIRVTELTATINYFYTDENIYLQKFFTNTTLPVEIQQGNSSIFYIQFSLPTNIASGYTNVEVKAKTEFWYSPAERWFNSDHPTYQPTLYIESPYKQQFEDQLDINRYNTTIMYLLGATTLVFAAVTAVLFILNRKARSITRSVA